MGPRRFGIGATFSLLVVSPAAHAHIGIPHADIIRFEPGNPRHAVMESAAYGFFETQDGGATFSFVCRAGIGDSTASDSLLPVALTASGRTVIAGGFFGLHAASPGLCSFEKYSGLAGSFVADVVTSPGGDVVYVAASQVGDAGSTSFVMRSFDDLRTLQPLGALPPGFVAARMAVAPSDPSRMYVAGFTYDATSSAYFPLLQRSRDAGLTWEGIAAPAVDGNNAHFGDIVVSPVDPDVFLIAANHTSETPTPALWVTFDGGTTHRLVESAILGATGFAVNLPIPGVAFSPDGAEAVFAGPEGLWHADVGALGRSAQSVEKYSDMPFRGLTWTSDGLYAGGWQFGSDPSVRFTIGVSHDGGRHFSPVFSVCHAVLGCGGTGGPAECERPVSNLQMDIIGSESCTNPGADPVPVVDGSSSHPQNDIGARGLSRGPGCACVVGRGVGRQGGLAPWLAAILALTARSRSKRPRARCSFCRFVRSRESSRDRRC